VAMRASAQGVAPFRAPCVLPRFASVVGVLRCPASPWPGRPYLKRGAPLRTFRSRLASVRVAQPRVPAVPCRPRSPPGRSGSTPSTPGPHRCWRRCLALTCVGSGVSCAPPWGASRLSRATSRWCAWGSGGAESLRLGPHRVLAELIGVGARPGSSGAVSPGFGRVGVLVELLGVGVRGVLMVLRRVAVAVLALRGVAFRRRRSAPVFVVAGCRRCSGRWAPRPACLVGRAIGCGRWGFRGSGAG
jgi:hypothetical protein